MLRPLAIYDKLLGLIWLCLLFAPFIRLHAQEASLEQPTPAGSRISNCELLERTVPPLGLEIPADQQAAWQTELATLGAMAGQLDPERRLDVEVLLKACRMAIEFRELYQERDFAKVDRLLGLARQRIADAAQPSQPWATAAGRQVRGFRSAVDGSVQPVGLLLPQDWQKASQPLPLYVWLHGRGDKSTDLHFLIERLDKDGQITPPGAIVLHPFGRQCVGYKSAGETDVMEAIDFVCANYPVDRGRIVLMGFSMGGAGVWHLAAHYGQRFVAASPGAGFAETARYQNLSPDRYPPVYEQMLWGIYDAPGYVRNLFNLPVVAYSGELDKQMQAALVMEEAYAAEGQQLTHLIGPGMGHKYFPQTLADIMQRMAHAVEQGQTVDPQQWYLQSRHPRYASYAWLTIDGFREQYADTRVDATRADDATWQLTTRNVQRVQIDGTQAHAPQGKLSLDGQTLPVKASGETLYNRGEDGTWQPVEGFPELRKRPGLSGPIDDAFIDPFLVVLPSGKSSQPRVDQWVACEAANFQQRWETLFRGQPRVKLDSRVTPADMAAYHLVLWGDAESNSLIARVLEAERTTSPLAWDTQAVRVGTRQFAAADHVLLAIRPNPLAAGKYYVLNSGPTFRQAHDRTNSLQNPHLPDWVVVGLDTPASVTSPGAIVATGFFSDRWQLDPELTWNPAAAAR